MGIYVHIPFCSHICPYCDFNTYRGMEPLIPRYIDALCAEIRRFEAEFGTLPAGSVFFGGGTPSLVPAAQIARVMSEIHVAFEVERDAEVTLEANPNSVDEEYFAGLLRAGVNRISIGAQTFDRRGLRTLGRQHEASDVANAVGAARSAGFESISCDLIFGWPGQTTDVWRRDLELALQMEEGIDHLSLYSLIVEPGTPMAEAVQRGVLVPLTDDEAADCYELAIDVLSTRGWAHYEIANWARSPERQSRHNMLYWRNGEYAGFGAGAHWRIGDVRRMNHLLPKTYIEAVERSETPVSNSEHITDEISMGETMVLGLRLLDEGVEATAFEVRHGRALANVFGDQLRELSELGLLEWDGKTARLTARGVLLGNDVTARFLGP